MKVTPHPAFVAHITARRGESDFAPPLPPFDAAATWKAVQAETVGNKAHYLHARIAHDDHIAKAAAMLKAGALPDPFDVMTVAVAERIIFRNFNTKTSTTLFRVVETERGLGDAVHVKLESTAIGVNRNDHELTFGGGDPWIASRDASWDVARAVVCRAGESAYAEARKAAAAWRSKYSVKPRLASSFLFPSESAWANEDFDEMLSLAKTDSWIYHPMFDLLSSVKDEARVVALIDQIIAGSNDYQLHNMMRLAACEVVLTLPPDGALRVIQKLLPKTRGANKSDVALLGQALAALEGEESATELAGLLVHPVIGPIAVDYFRRFRTLAEAVLPKVGGTSKAADAARSLLAAGKPDDSPMAEAGEVPAILHDAPWRKKKKTKPAALGAPPPLPKTVIVWESAAEKEQATHGWGGYATDHALLEMSSDVLEQWRRVNPRGRPVDMWMRFGTVHAHRTDFRVPDAVGLEEWNTNAYAATVLGPLRMLAIHGDAALPGLFARDAFSPQQDWHVAAVLDAQLHAVGPEASRVAASALIRRKAWRKKVQEWITSHAPVVAQSLVPVALGKESRERKEAEHAVRFAARTHKQAVLDAAKALGDDAERAMREIIEREPLTDLDVKGKLPAFIRVADLPALKTKTGKRLPEGAVEALLEILRSTSPDMPYAGIESIAAELDEGSLGDFAWALVQTWILAGAKGSFAWIPLSLALVGDDSCARRLAPYVREWARKDAKKANMCADVLAAMGSPTALLHLSYIADKSRFDEAKKHATETLERVAAQQGLSTDELADRTVPDLELDRDGTATLDFGPRKLTVTFDESLTPVLKSEDGTRLPSLPRGTKTDDAVKVKAASARYKGLKADAEVVAQTLLRRFERAMIDGRAWRADSFRQYVIQHPLVTHIARRLVWSADGKAFRVADDGTFADEHDAARELGDSVTVTLPHPLRLGKDAVAAWSRIAGDYAIVQPFEQLGRAVHTLDEPEARESRLSRYEGKTSKPGPLMGSLESRGWQKWPDETSLSSCGKKVRAKSGEAGEAQVHLTFSPGIELSDVAHAPDQVLHAPTLSGASSWADLDPVDLSELLRDMEFIAH